MPTEKWIWNNRMRLAGQHIDEIGTAKGLASDIAHIPGAELSIDEDVKFILKYPKTSPLHARSTYLVELKDKWRLTQEDVQFVTKYLESTRLILECLQLANVSDRKAIEDRLLLPPP